MHSEKQPERSNNEPVLTALAEEDAAPVEIEVTEEIIARDTCASMDLIRLIGLSVGCHLKKSFARSTVRCIRHVKK